MFRVTKFGENNFIEWSEFKYKTREEAEEAKLSIIENEGLSELSVIVESEEQYKQSNEWVDNLTLDGKTN